MSVRKLCKELQERAINELNEEPEKTLEKIRLIRKWLSTQSHITARTDDQWLLFFLRGCKFDLEKVKEKLEYYYKAKSRLPEIYRDRDPQSPGIQEVLKEGFIIVLPNDDPNFPRVIFIRPYPEDPKRITPELILKVSTMVQEVLIIEDDVAAVNGVIVLIDASEFKMHHLVQTPLSLVKKLMGLYQYGYANRIKGIFCMNSSPILEMLLNFFCRMLSKKLKNRLRVFSSQNAEGVFECIPKSIIPEEYGGDAGPIQNMIDIWKTKIESHRNWFLEDPKYVAVDKIKTKRPDLDCEIESDFKQLSFD